MFLILFFLPPALRAHHLEEEPTFSGEYFRTQTLTGDWNGARTRLWERGWAPELDYLGEVFYNPAGGSRRQAEYAGFLDFDLHMDLGRVLGWRNTRALINYIGTHGTQPSRSLGTAQTVSAFEASDTFQLFQAWVETFALGNRLSFKAGIYSLDTEFDFKETANLFINGVFGTGLDLSETGVNGPAIFPHSALGARLALKPLPGWYVQMAALDGVPGIPGDTTGTRIRLDENDGVQVAVETGYESSGQGVLHDKAGLGALLYTTSVPDQVAVDTAGMPVGHSGTHSLYGFIDWGVYAEAGRPEEGMKALLRMGLADENVARFDYDVTAALMYAGLLPGRETDRTGLGVSVAHNGGPYKTAQRNQGRTVDDVEVVIEATHQIHPGRGIVLQPNLQYFINPGSNPNLNDVWYLGLHFGLAF